MLRSPMQAGASHRSHTSLTCAVFETRALCVVCGASAIGRNFDAYTCLSCKAFFRRNAYNEHIRFTCRVMGSCEINMLTRRHCSACRLNKCFQQGMRKELIRSLAAMKQAASSMLLTRQHHEQLSPRLVVAEPVVSDNPLALTVDDWTLLTNIRNAYELHCVEPFLASHQKVPLTVTAQPHRSRVKLQRLVDLTNKYLSVIVSFVKRILEFNAPLKTDYEYIKDNLPTLLIVNITELLKSNVLKNVPWEYDRCLFESVFAEGLLKRLEEHLNVCDRFLLHDPLIIKLFLIVLALSPRTSPVARKERYTPVDFRSFPRRLIRAQSRYSTLLWKYVTYRLGPHDAAIHFVRFTQHFLRTQSIGCELIESVYHRDDHGQLLALFEADIDFS